MLIRLGIAGLIGGAVMMFFGWQEWSLSSSASDKAEEMTLEALIQRGPEGNPHIIIADFDGCENLVYETRKRSSTWEKVWVPLVPLAKDEAEANLKPSNVQVMLYTQNAPSEQKLNEMILKDKLQGMVTNKIDSLSSSVRGKLLQSYPQTDFDKCIIFEEGRTPGGMGYVMGMGGGGLALFLVGGLMAVMGFKQG